MHRGIVGLRFDKKALLDSRAGGILATVRPNGESHLVYMLYAATERLELLLVTDPRHEHTSHMGTHPRVAFLVDTRERISDSVAAFHRLEVRGDAEAIAADAVDYPECQRTLVERNPMMPGFLDRGCQIFRVRPEVLLLNRGGEKIEYRPPDSKREV